MPRSCVARRSALLVAAALWLAPSADCAAAKAPEAPKPVAQAPTASTGTASAAPSLKPGEIRVVIDGHPATARASSTLPAKDGRYSVANLFDGRLDTAWVEGAEGVGVGEWLELEFDEPVDLDGFLLAPGYGKSPSTFLENVSPFRVKVQGDGYTVSDNNIRYPMGFGCSDRAIPTAWGPRVVVFHQVQQVKVLRLQILEATWAMDMKYRDLAITEWRPILKGRPPQAPPGWQPIASFTVDLVRGIRSGTIDKRLLSPKLLVEDIFRVASGDSFLEERLRGRFLSTGALPERDHLLNFQALFEESQDGAITLVARDSGYAIVPARIFDIGIEYERLAFNYALFVDPSDATAFTITAMRVMTEPMKCNDASLPDLSAFE
jgi:hypothetical protein